MGQGAYSGPLSIIRPTATLALSSSVDSIGAEAGIVSTRKGLNLMGIILQGTALYL